MRKIKKSLLFGLIILIFGLAGFASAVSVSISPDYIDEGDTITINFQDLTNGSSFAMKMVSLIDIGNETDFEFEVSNVNMPFSMTDPEVNVIAKPVKSAGLKAISGGSIKTVEYLADETEGVNIIRELTNLNSGSIEALRVFGETTEETQNVDISL